MLTEKQLHERQSTLGASEVASVLGISRWHTPLDVWSRKRRGVAGEHPPLVLPTPSTGPAAMGHRLEGAIAELYSADTGATLHDPGASCTHPGEPWASATPDRVDNDHNIGIECKLVGPRMLHDWDDGVPDYVRSQALWQIYACGFDAVDVAALIAGTDFRVARIARDADEIATMASYCKSWWTCHVIGNVAPPPEDAADEQRALVALRPKDSGEKVDAPPESLDVAREFHQLRTSIAEMKARESALKVRLMAMIGDARSMHGDWGRAQWATTRGSTSWKSVAEELLLPVAADDRAALLERHRGNDYRKFGFYPRKDFA